MEMELEMATAILAVRGIPTYMCMCLRVCKRMNISLYKHSCSRDRERERLRVCVCVCVCVCARRATKLYRISFQPRLVFQ